MQGSTPPFAGRTLHSNCLTRAQVHPRERGIVFRRVDLPGRPTIPADLDHVQVAARRTRLADGSASIDTVEHVLSALAGLGVDAAEVWVWGSELPQLDGSALPWANAIHRASQPDGRRSVARWQPSRRWTWRDGDSRCEILPSDRPTLSCTIDYEHPAIGHQQLEVELDRPAHYLARVAPARTFGLLGEAEILREQGLAQGASLESVLVFDEAGVSSPSGLRYADEPVRHKVLDAVGDLALLGAPLGGRIELVRSSHAFLIASLRRAVGLGVLRLVG